MGFLLTIFYFTLLFLLLSRWLPNSGIKISKWEILALFVVKVVVGFIYGYIHINYYIGDTWAYFDFGKLIFEVAKSNPLDFIKISLLPLPQEPLSAELANLKETIPFWHQTSSYTMVRLNGLLNFLSFGYYSVHVAFWAFLSLIGTLTLFASINKFSFQHSRYLFYALFLIPSFLFWGSGIHKEAICIFSLGLILYNSIQIIDNRTGFLNILAILLSVLLLFLIRPYALGLFIPALAGLLISRKTKFDPLYIFTGIYGFCLISGTAISMVSSKFNIFQKLVDIQSVYLIYYNGNSDVLLNILEPNFLSVLLNTPQAIFNTIFRPGFWDITNKLSVIASLETFLFSIGFLVSIYLILRKAKVNKAFFYFCVFFAFSYLILIGLTIDNLGAIVRYRTIPFLFLVCGIFYILNQNNSVETKKLIHKDSISK